jgi:mycothiol system anti-sigma-R factor
MSDHCDEALANLYTYLDGELDDPEVVARIREHLDECPPCDQSFTFEERLKTVVRVRLQEDVPTAVVDRLREIIVRERG